MHSMAATTSVSGPVSSRRNKRPLWRRRRVQWGSAALLAAVAAVLLVLHFAEFEWREIGKDIPGWLQQVNEPLALVLMATLPPAEERQCASHRFSTVAGMDVAPGAFVQSSSAQSPTLCRRMRCLRKIRRWPLAIAA